MPLTAYSAETASHWADAKYTLHQRLWGVAGTGCLPGTLWTGSVTVHLLV